MVSNVGILFIRHSYRRRNDVFLRIKTQEQFVRIPANIKVYFKTSDETIINFEFTETLENFFHKIKAGESVSTFAIHIEDSHLYSFIPISVLKRWPDKCDEILSRILFAALSK